MGRRSNPSKVAEKANVVNANLEGDLATNKKIMKPEPIRRSQRIQNTSTSVQSKSQPEEIVIIETEEQYEDELSGQEVENLPTVEEQDEDEPSGQKVDKHTESAQNDEIVEEQQGDVPSGNEEELPEVAQNAKIMEKIDYLVELVEAQEKTTEASNVTGQMSDKILYSPVARYKIMYFKSQKKIAELRDDNRQMALKLENALGKLEVYEKGQNIFPEVLDKVKDFVSSMSKFTETACQSGVSPDNSEPEEPPAKKKHKKGGSKRTG